MRLVFATIITIAVVYCECTETGLDQVNRAIGTFSMKLLQMSITSNANYVASPYSIASALAMCLLGAEGSTFIALREALGFSGMSRESIEAAFKQSSEKLSATGFVQGNGYVINKANRVYIDEKFKVNAIFNDTLNEVFNSFVEQVDFAAHGAEIQKQVNDFVKKSTHGLIDKLVEKPFPATTSMALVNAVYFKGNWASPWSITSEGTKFNGFHCPNQGSHKRKHRKSRKSLVWMFKRKTYPYIESDDLQATMIQVPYVPNAKSKDQASMLLILPHDEHKCAFTSWVNSHMIWPKIEEAVSAMKPAKTNLIIPKFKVHSTFELADPLTKLGMGDAFSSNANFTRMISANKSPKIDTVIHQAKIQVDEKGTLATAATLVTMVRTAGVEHELKQFVVNRSFVAVIAIKQENTLMPLFTSAIVDL